MKKIIKKILMIGMVCSLLTACGSSKKDITTKTEEGSADVSGKVTEEKESEKLLIVEKGYSLVDGSVNWGVVVKNPNKDKVSEYAEIIVTAKDENGKVIATDNQTLNCVFQNTTTSWAGRFDVEGKAPKEVIFDVSTGEYSDVDLIDEVNSDDIVVSNPDCKKKDDGFRFTGEVKNIARKNASGVEITILLKNNKKIVGGTTTYLSELNAKQKRPFEEIAFDLPSFDEYIMSAQIW